MKILAFDCSSKTMSAVVGENDAVSACDFSAENRNHAPYLMPMIHSVLADAKTDIHDIDLLGVTVGPGSFTGLRIGIATAKGFADLLNIPVVPICSLDALAQNYSQTCGILVPILDARKNQVYASVYDNRKGKMEKIMQETPISPLAELDSYLPKGEDILFFGDAVPGWQEKITEYYGIRAKFGVSENIGIRGEALLNLTYHSETKIDSEALMPMYLRGVDAKAKFTDYVIEEMLEQDVSELVELDKGVFPKPWSYGMFISELRNGYGHYWVIRLEGKIVGYCGFWLIGNECHITNIAVHCDYHHMGLGRALVEHIIVMAKLYGAHGITLEVRPSNTVAHNLYLNHGFKDEGLRKKYYEDNGEDAIIMWYYFPDFSDEKPWR